MAQPRQLPKMRQLLGHSMMGMALGILCAGLLLAGHVTDIAQLVNTQQQPWLARLVFLVSVGFSFGLGATLTGALFLSCEAHDPR